MESSAPHAPPYEQRLASSRLGASWVGSNHVYVLPISRQWRGRHHVSVGLGPPQHGNGAVAATAANLGRRTGLAGPAGCAASPTQPEPRTERAEGRRSCSLSSGWTTLRHCCAAPTRSSVPSPLPATALRFPTAMAAPTPPLRGAPSPARSVRAHAPRSAATMRAARDARDAASSAKADLKLGCCRRRPPSAAARRTAFGSARPCASRRRRSPQPLQRARLSRRHCWWTHFQGAATRFGLVPV
jgi:hypothetical protein